MQDRGASRGRRQLIHHPRHSVSSLAELLLRVSRRQGTALFLLSLPPLGWALLFGMEQKAAVAEQAGALLGCRSFLQDKWLQRSLHPSQTPPDFRYPLSHLFMETPEKWQQPPWCCRSPRLLRLLPAPQTTWLPLPPGISASFSPGLCRDLPNQAQVQNPPSPNKLSSRRGAGTNKPLCSIQQLFFSLASILLGPSPSPGADAIRSN